MSNLRNCAIFALSSLLTRLSPAAAFGDLRDVLQVSFQQIGGGGRVVVFTSSVDNGTGDSLLRTE